ncbi:MAG TPA: M56 family metallopeptidase [Terriglobales bacterium]|nr:M56 family metallopeptidase [Terriglobales bacterium]
MVARARSHGPIAGFTVVGTAIIVATVAIYPSSVERLLLPGSWPRLMVLAVLPLLALIAVAWLARLGFVLARAALTVGRLPRTDQLPARLRTSVARTGVERVQCISSSLPIAFCAGARRPRVIVSEGLAEQLDDRELEAVLLHERQHLREREPVVRAACEAAAQVLVFFPLARWWSRRRMERAELRADQAALRRVGPRPVAAALFRLGSTIPAAAAFAGDSQLRVAQLLGDPLPTPRPAAVTVATSLIGFPFAAAVVGCAILNIAQLLSI